MLLWVGVCVLNHEWIHEDDARIPPSPPPSTNPGGYYRPCIDGYFCKTTWSNKQQSNKQQFLVLMDTFVRLHDRINNISFSSITFTATPICRILISSSSSSSSSSSDTITRQHHRQHHRQPCVSTLDSWQTRVLLCMTWCREPVSTTSECVC